MYMYKGRCLDIEDTIVPVSKYQTQTTFRLTSSQLDLYLSW